MFTENSNFKKTFRYGDISIKVGLSNIEMNSRYGHGEYACRLYLTCYLENVVDTFVELVEWFGLPTIIQIHDDANIIQSILCSKQNSPEKEKIVLALNKTNSKILSWNGYKGTCGKIIARDGFDIYERTEDGKIVCRDGRPIVKSHVQAKYCAGWDTYYTNSFGKLVLHVPTDGENTIDLSKPFADFERCCKELEEMRAEEEEEDRKNGRESIDIF